MDCSPNWPVTCTVLAVPCPGGSVHTSAVSACDSTAHAAATPFTATLSFTTAGVLKPVPCRVSAVPPAVYSDVADTAVMTGVYEKLTALDCCPATVSVTGTLAPLPTGTAHSTRWCAQLPPLVQSQLAPLTDTSPLMPNDTPVSVMYAPLPDAAPRGCTG